MAVHDGTVPSIKRQGYIPAERRFRYDGEAALGYQHHFAGSRWWHRNKGFVKSISSLVKFSVNMLVVSTDQINIATEEAYPQPTGRYAAYHISGLPARNWNRALHHAQQVVSPVDFGMETTIGKCPR